MVFNHLLSPTLKCFFANKIITCSTKSQMKRFPPSETKFVENQWKIVGFAGFVNFCGVGLAFRRAACFSTERASLMSSTNNITEVFP